MLRLAPSCIQPMRHVAVGELGADGADVQWRADRGFVDRLQQRGDLGEDGGGGAVGARYSNAFAVAYSASPGIKRMQSGSK